MDINSVLHELESIGVIGDGKVVLLKPRLVPEQSESEPESPKQLDTRNAQMERTAALALEAAQKLEVAIAALQDLQTTFQQLHESTQQGESHANVQEEA